jgi:hypothetical protein
MVPGETEEIEFPAPVMTFECNREEIGIFAVYDLSPVGSDVGQVRDHGRDAGLVSLD